MTHTVDDETVTDLVCFMNVPKKTALTYEYKGKLYYFCSANCRDTFSVEPEMYVDKDEPILT